MKKRHAVLDTSFWTVAVHVGVDAYLPLLLPMPIYVPSAVQSEIERKGTENRRLREDQQRFRLWLEDKRLVLRDPQKPFPLLGRGEAACLGLAREQNLHILINERKGYIEAKKLNIRPVTVPEAVVRLTVNERISVKKANKMLDTLKGTTAIEIIEAAQNFLKRFEHRGEGGCST